ncbi:MAG: hypothetical protein ACRDKH_05985, partial [Solirubrobacterales bacterium]
MIRIGFRDVISLSMSPTQSNAEIEGIPRREGWRRDLAPFLEVDRRRSLGQIATVVIPYLGVWVLAAIIRPGTWLAIGLGLVATVFLVRMYSLFH